MTDRLALAPMFLALSAIAIAQPVTLHNPVASAVLYKGKQATRLTAPEGAIPGADHLAIPPGVEFSNGTIEVDIVGEPAPTAGAAAHGFAGVAFRVQPDLSTYDCFYVRPTNGRAEDQERRNHSVQYISHPQFTWSKLRQETPSRYESYADMQPGE